MQVLFVHSSGPILVLETERSMGSTIVKNYRRRRGIKMLRLPAVEDRVGYKKTRIYDLISKGRFPPPVKLGARRIAWPEHVIDEYLAQKITGSASAD
jgi:prophage regulatory protein